MNLVIGADLDSYGELGGTNLFNSARQICLLGANNNGQGYQTISQPGELTRYNIVSDLVDLRYEDLRKLVFAFFYDGLDLMVTNKEKGLSNLISIIGEMADFKKNKMTGPSAYLQIFFDAKAKEIAQTLTGNDNEQVFKDLMYLDPSNSSLYQQAMDQ